MFLLSPRRNRAAPHWLILSVVGTYRIAVRRNCGHVGQEALARMCDTQIGRWAIGRAEHLLACHCLRAAQSWYCRLYWLLDFRYAQALLPHGLHIQIVLPASTAKPPAGSPGQVPCILFRLVLFVKPTVGSSSSLSWRSTAGRLEIHAVRDSQLER